MLYHFHKSLYRYILLVNDLQLSVTLGAKAKALMQLAEIFANEYG